MTNEDAVKWMENLKSDIGKMQFRALWGYEQAMDEIIKLLSADPCKSNDQKVADVLSGDLISRKEAISIPFLPKEHRRYQTINIDDAYEQGWCDLEECIQSLPSAGPNTGEWIPCSERLPEDSGDYLVCPSDGVIEDYSDCRDVMIMPYDADCEAFGWWTERYDPISLGFVDSDFNEFEVVAWMPLPKPYGERRKQCD